MKRAYMKPAMQVVEVQQDGIICTSGWDIIGPGTPNQPAGAKDYNNWDEIWDDDRSE